jgi:hypothetical protein
MNFSPSYTGLHKPEITTRQTTSLARVLNRVLTLQLSVLVLIVLSLLLGWAVRLPAAMLFSGAVVGLTLFATATIVGFFPHVFDIRLFRIPGMFVTAYLLMIILPTPLVYADHPTTARNTYLFATMVSFLCTITGVVFIYLNFPRGMASIRHWLARPIKTDNSARRMSILLFLICFLLLFGYVRQIGTLPIQQALLGGNSTLELAQAREDSLKLISGRIVYVYALLRSVLFPYVAMLSVIIASTTARPIWLAIATLSIFGNVVMASATLEKSPLAASFIMLCFTWLLLRRKPLSPKRLFLIALVALAFPAFILLAVYQFDIPFSSLVDALWERLFIVPAEVLYFHFEYFPSMHEFLWGRTLPFLSKLLPGGPFAITNELCLYIIPDTAILSCSANAAYPAALWADFGWLGIIIGSFIVGGMIQGLQFVTQALPKSGPTVVLQAFLAFQVIFLTSAALPDVIFANGMGYATALTLVILLMQRRSKKFNQPIG